MLDPEKNRNIAARPSFALDEDQRRKYKEAIMPFVIAAKKAYEPILEVREQDKFLAREQCRINGLINVSNNPHEGRHPLSAALTGIKISRAELKITPALHSAKESFRLVANKLIAEVNRQKAGFALLTNLVNPGATALIGQPQIPPDERRNKFEKPESPVRPHNALGVLSIYRDRIVRPDLKRAISVQSRTLGTGSIEVSLALSQLLPNHFIKTSTSTPCELRNPDELAKQIIELSQLVARYDAGILKPPTSEELGTRSVEQDKHITTQLRSLLAHFLRGELENPNMSEKQLQDFYQELSNYIRNAAKHITPQYSHEGASYERVGLLIEKLPGIEGAMIASRLSTNLFQDLGLPCLDYVGENRLAEVMRNIANGGHWSPRNRGSIAVEGYVVSEENRAQLGKVIESIDARLDRNEIDCQKMFEAIESLDYGDLVLRKLFEIADDDQKGVLLRALVESNCFSDELRALRSKQDYYYNDYDSD